MQQLGMSAHFSRVWILMYVSAGGPMNLDNYIISTGVTVIAGKLPPGRWGLYDWERHRIVMSPRLGAVQHRSTLAHELGHAWYRHRGTTTRDEREASVWAARRLIDPDDFMDAIKVSEHRTGVAQILGVMPSDVDTYVSILGLGEIQRLVQDELAC